MEAVAAEPLVAANDLGIRDRLSLVAQFAAHTAFLQFAGVADGAFESSDWGVVRKRGRDCRLVRVEAGSAGGSLSSIHDFAACVGENGLETLKRSWVRAESVYAEAASKLRADIAADLCWMRCAAAGEVISPGADALRVIWSSPAGLFRYSDARIADALAMLDENLRIVTIGTTFPLQRYSALASIDPALVDSAMTETEAAERLSSRFALQRMVVIVGPEETLDSATRQVVAIASQLGTATWLLTDRDDTLPASTFFVLAPRLSARNALDAVIAAAPDPRRWIEEFVTSPAYDRYLDEGVVPAPQTNFDRVREPIRSYVAALALLGVSIPRDVAVTFMHEFAFDQPLERLAIDGICHVDEKTFSFTSAAIRDHCVALIPAASRPALWQRALDLLEGLEWKSAEDLITALRSIPRQTLTPTLAQRLAAAFIDCGRYRDAIDLAPLMQSAAAEEMLARCERRMGDYATALARVSRLPNPTPDAQLLSCELLRLSGRHAEARDKIAGLHAKGLRWSYERALIDLELGTIDDSWIAADHYFSLRFRTYEALRRGDFEAAERLSREALRMAGCVVEEIDAWLDRVFTSFSAGAWTETRSLALQALAVIDEAHGDRAASAIVYTLAYLAADDAQWTTAEHLIKRLREHASDPDRVAELELLDAHLDFCRGAFADARRRAIAVHGCATLITQIREAAALIVDEIDWIEHRRGTLLSTGESGNVEMRRRHEVVAGKRKPVDAARSRSEKLQLFRVALRNGNIDLAQSIASELGLTMSRSAAANQPEVEVLTIAATANYPFRDDEFGGTRWCYASRNRLGHWTCIGSAPRPGVELDWLLSNGGEDWVANGDRELLYIEGLDQWADAARRAIASLFSIRAEAARLRRLTSNEEAEPRKADASHEIVGTSAAIRSVFHLIDRIAKRDVAVCIVGESGTGKELVARAIQRSSQRRSKPFTTINCAALPETLIESELFGHMRGAFTGADRDRAGLIESADGGTLFLDEVGELPLAAQAKLLRFLQDGEFRRLGDTQTRSADVRILSATNRKLEEAVEDDSFREDLYYRLRGVEIPLPPLRDRGDDVLLLADHFLTAERTRHRSGPVALSSEVETLFRAYRWPGNVRELQNTIRAAHAMAGDDREVQLEHLPERLRQTMPMKTAAGSYQDAVARFRRDLIERSLVEAAGNQNRAAAMLNMSRQALAYQIRELGIMVRKRPRM